jgi:ferredoxin
MTVLLSVDADACLGTGLCRALSPELFAAADDGRARVTEQFLDDPERVERAIATAECCPAGAIAVRKLADSARTQWKETGA